MQNEKNNTEKYLWILIHRVNMFVNSTIRQVCGQSKKLFSTVNLLSLRWDGRFRILKVLFL